MALIAQTLSDERLDDFVPVKQVAKELGLHAQTVKKWLKKNVVSGVKWGRDRRDWVYVHRDALPVLKRYAKSIRVQ